MIYFLPFCNFGFVLWIVFVSFNLRFNPTNFLPYSYFMLRIVPSSKYFVVYMSKVLQLFCGLAHNNPPSWDFFSFCFSTCFPVISNYFWRRFQDRLRSYDMIFPILSLKVHHIIDVCVQIPVLKILTNFESIWILWRINEKIMLKIWKST